MATRSITAIVLEHLMGTIMVVLPTTPLAILSCVLGNAIALFTTHQNAAQISALGAAVVLFTCPILATSFLVWMDLRGRLPKGGGREYFEGLAYKKKASVALVFAFMFLYLVSIPSYEGVIVFSSFVEPVDISFLIKAPYAAVLGAWALVGLYALAMAPVGLYVIVSDKDLFSVLFKFGDVPRRDKVVAEAQKKN